MPSNPNKDDVEAELRAAEEHLAFLRYRSEQKRIAEEKARKEQEERERKEREAGQRAAKGKAKGKGRAVVAESKVSDIPSVRGTEILTISIETSTGQL
jgi:hypothetical protein